MKTPKQTLDKLNEGCGKNLYEDGEFICACGYWKHNEVRTYCKVCQARKNQFIEDCKNELEFLENSEIWEELEHPEIEERINQLKEVINSEGKG